MILYIGSLLVFVVVVSQCHRFQDVVELNGVELDDDSSDLVQEPALPEGCHSFTFKLQDAEKIGASAEKECALLLARCHHGPLGKRCN